MASPTKTISNPIGALAALTNVPSAVLLNALGNLVTGGAAALATLSPTVFSATAAMAAFFGYLKWRKDRQVLAQAAESFEILKQSANDNLTALQLIVDIAKGNLPLPDKTPETLKGEIQEACRRASDARTSGISPETMAEFVAIVGEHGSKEQIKALCEEFGEFSEVAQVLLWTQDHRGREQDEVLRKILEVVLRIADRAPHFLESARKPIQLPYPSIQTLFKGREHFLTDLRAALMDNPPAGATAIIGRAVHGLGGVGKTRLAVEYAWRRAEDYTAVLFAVADSPENLRRSLASFVEADVLNLAERELKEEDARFDAVLAWFAAHPGWLLILDNADAEPAAAAVENLLPKLQGGHVLITSRLNRWSPAIETRELDTLSPEAAVEFLLERTKSRRKITPSDGSDARALARELDGLALALEQAGAYISVKRISIGKYLELWRGHVAEVQAWYDAREMKYPQSMAVTWQTTTDMLGPAELAFLRLLCWYAPDPFPLFVSDGENAAKLWGMAIELAQAENPDKRKTSDKLADAVNALADYSMIRFDSQANAVTMHRVLQEILRTRTPEAHRDSALLLALHLLLQACPLDAADVNTWPKWNLLQSHVTAAVRFGDEARIAQPTDALMGRLATHLYAKALHAETEALMRRVLAITEASYGMTDPRTALALNNLAALLQATNRLADAELLMRRALDIDEKSYGPHHPNVAIRLNNLAQLLQDTNRLADAEPLMRRVVEIFETFYGKTHPSVATALNNLAGLLQATNRLADAEPLIRRALDIDEKSFGSHHPNVAIRLHNLAQLLQDTNRLADAEPLIRRALDIDEKSFGPHHPKVATGLSNLAGLLQDTNRFVDAEPLMCRALEIDETSLGPHHPKVALRLNNLAQLFKATNRLADAEPLMRRALDIDEESFGPHHPNVAVRLNNLAQLLQATNHLADAEPLIRRALDIDEKSFGPHHPKVAIRLNNLAALLEATNRLADAERLMRRALDIGEKSFGPHHPKVAIGLNNLAHLLQATNRLAEAEPLMRRHVEIFHDFTRATGHQHPHMQTALTNYLGILIAMKLPQSEITARLKDLIP